MNQNNRELPVGWEWSSLGVICDIIVGHTPDRKQSDYWDGTYPWATIADMKSDIITTTKEGISESASKLSSNRLLKQGTLLFSFKLSIGKTAFAGCDLYTNEAIAGLIPKNARILNPSFLSYALATMNFDAATGDAAKGKTLNLKSMKKLSVPIAPLPVQLQLVRILNEAKALEQLNEEANRKIKTLQLSLLQKAFKGEL